MQFVKKIKPFYKDERGNISHLLPKDVIITSALLITSKKGSIRANHYHKKDTHYVYMIKGKMEYSYKNMKSSGKEKMILVNEGDIIHTPPNIFHKMKFLEESVFIALTTEPREKEKYEADTVRVP